MRNSLGCLYFVFVLPFVVAIGIGGWVLSRFIDPRRFLALTEGRSFDFVGRWHTGDSIGIYGMFGVTAPEGIDSDLEVSIYYSRFQALRRGEIETRSFALASSCDGIPVATKHGDETHFSHEDGGQLIWLGWSHDNDLSRDGWFATMRPGSFGSLKLIENLGRTRRGKSTACP